MYLWRRRFDTVTIQPMLDWLHDLKGSTGLVRHPMHALVGENFLGQPIAIPVSFSIFALLKTLSYAAQKQKYRKS